MVSSQLLVVLVAAVAVWAGVAALRRAAIPTPVVLVVAGVILGFLPFVPDTTLEPHVVLLGFLPLLIFQASFSSSPRAFLRQSPQIGLLATGLVVITAGVVAVVAHDVGNLSWAMSFVLGTAVGPTDAAAAVSIARRVGLPRQLSTILEGEALFNDATALVLYAAAITAATNGHFSIAHTAGSIIYGAAVGVAVGLAVGIVGRLIGRRLDDPPIEIVLSLLLAYAAYLPAERLGASGVLATVTAGLYLGWHDSASSSARTRLQSRVFWDTLDFLLNAALFILVGLSLHTFTATTRGPVGRLVLTGVGVIGAVIVVRAVWVACMSVALRPLRRLGGAGHHRREQVVLGWAGMRGAVTLAAVLAVPTVTKDGDLLRGRDDVIYLGFAVIFVTLIGQGLSLPFLARRFQAGEDPTLRETERQARLALLRAGLHLLDQEAKSGRLPEEVTDALRATFDARVRRLDHPADDAETHEQVLEEERSLRRQLIAVQRARLVQLREDGLGLTTARQIERDLDLDESRLR